MKYTKQEIQEAKEDLRKLINVGDTIYTVVRHISASGMSRVITLHIIKDGEVQNISFTAAKLLEGYDYKHEGCKAGGCGMDMCFHLVYNLGRVLFSDGFDLVAGQYGRNGDTSGHDNDGGYALKYRSL